MIPAKHNGKPVVRIGDNAFSYSSMYKIVIPEGVTKIEHSAFWRCDNLECVILPSSIQDIERCAMLLNNDDWPIVEEIIYKGTKKEWKSVRLGDVWSAPNNVICSDGVAYCNKFRYYDP